MTTTTDTAAPLHHLKLMAEDAAKIYGDEWDSALVGDEAGNFHAITSEKTEDIVIRASDDSLHSSWLCDYLEAASPRNILALIARTESAEARVKELEAKLANPVVPPAYRNSPDMHTKQYYEAIGFNQGLDAYEVAVTEAGFTVNAAEEQQ